MSFLLEADNYARVHSLFEEMTHHLAVVTVLAGITPGKIYVDDPVSPGTAILIPSNQYRIYVSGSLEPRILKNIIDIHFKQSPAESYRFVVYYASNTWKQILEQLFEKQESFSGWSQFYRLRGPSSPLSKPLPEKVTISRIDEAMVGNATLENRQLLIEEIYSESPSLEHFFRKNFGFSAQDGHKLVGWCLAEYH